MNRPRFAENEASCSKYTKQLKKSIISLISSICHVCESFKRSNDDITALMLVSMVTKIIAICFLVFQPCFTKCYGYWETWSLLHIVALYVNIVVLFASVSFLLAGCTTPYKAYINILFLNQLCVLSMPLILLSSAGCYPDVEIQRPLIHFGEYFREVAENKEYKCLWHTNNCYVKYFNKGLFLSFYCSLFVKCLHTLVRCRQAMKRVNRVEAQLVMPDIPRIRHIRKEQVPPIGEQSRWPAEQRVTQASLAMEKANYNVLSHPRYTPPPRTPLPTRRERKSPFVKPKMN